MKFIKGFFLTIFSIILIVFTLAYFVLSGVQMTVLRPQYYKGIVSDIDVPNAIFTVLEEYLDENFDNENEQYEGIKDIAITSMKEVFDKEWANKVAANAVDDIFLIINDANAEKKIEIDLTGKGEEFSNVLKTNLREYIDNETDENISDSELDEVISNFMNEVKIFKEDSYTVDLSKFVESKDFSEYTTLYREYRIYSLIGPYVVFLVLLLIIVLIAGFKSGMRWISTDMMIPSILFILIFTVGGFLVVKPLLINVATQSNFNNMSIINVIFNNTLFSLLVVPAIFLVISIILKIIFKKKKEEPVIMNAGNIVEQAQL